MTEVWLPCAEWPGYEVSDLGRVRSVGRWMIHHRHKTNMWWKEKVLKPGAQKSGHLFVVLTGQRAVRVHRLVAQAFIGSPPFPDAQVLHWDDNPANNVSTNLRYGTCKDNADDQKRNGVSMGGYRPRGSRQIAPGVFQ